MKRIISVAMLSFLLVFMVCSVASAEVVVKGGLDMFGTVSLGMSGLSLENDTKMGISIGGEYLTEMSDGLYLGGGIEYQFNRKNEGADKGFSFIPIYGMAQYYFSDNTYLLGRIGYNFFSIEDEDDYEGVKTNGGMYFSFGAGFWVQENMILEAVYAIHNAEVEEEGYSEVDWDYSKLGVSVGFVF